MIFGLLLTACGCGAVAGPVLMAVVRERSGGYAVALVVLAAGMLLGAAITLGLHPPGAAICSSATKRPGMGGLDSSALRRGSR